MTIVTNRGPRRRRQRKPAQALAIAVPRIVRYDPRRRVPKPLAVDPEADARVAAFMARMIRPTR